MEMGLQQAFLHGRCELVQLEGVDVLLDVAHNAHAMQYFIQRLQKMKTIGKRHIVIGMLKDKNVEESLNLLVSERFENWFLSSLPGRRGGTAERLSNHLNEIGITHTSSHSSPDLAFESAYQVAVPGDLIVVIGSFHTVASVMNSDRMKPLFFERTS
jgi:dihydrofolate synthase/folylpolyglutamate synthase